MQDYEKTIYLAHPPTGTWTSGPNILYDWKDSFDAVEKYQKMGWTVTGPYKLVEKDD